MSQLRSRQTFLLATCLVFSLIIRLVPILNNHFYFTIDQGRDAIAVRDILHGHLTLLGPQTSVEHVYHGVLWYYLLVIPYVVFSGSPFGAVVLMIAVSLATLFLAYKIGAQWGSGFALLIILSIFLPFYETSRYAFNPFLLPILGLAFIFSLTKVRRNFTQYLYLAACAVGLSFHADIMAFIPFATTFFVVSIYLLTKQKKILESLFIAWGIVGLFLLPHFISEVLNGFSQWNALLEYLKSSDASFFEQFKVGVEIFVNLIGEVLLPQLPAIGAVIFGITIAVGFKLKKLNSFVGFLLLLFAISFLWFSSNKGLRPWQTVYIGPLLLASFAAVISSLQKKWKLLIFVILFGVHAQFTFTRILSYMKNTHDAGLLSNQLAAIDWIYKKANGQGFFIYTYVPSIYDYHYQYLIYWRGKNAYGYVPCQYSTYPGTDSSSYIEFKNEYESPEKPCTKQNYLILEPPVAQSLQDQWHSEVSGNTQLLEKTNVGDITIEKRQRN